MSITKKSITLIVTILLMTMIGTLAAQNTNASANRPNTSTYYGLQPSSTKNKNAVELIYYPLGILPKNVTSFTYNDALDYVTLRTTWTIIGHTTYFSTDVNNGFDIKWHDLPINDASISFGKYMHWDYSISFKKSEYSQSQAEAYTNQFIKELTDEEFSVETSGMEGKPGFPISKKLRKGTYKIEVTLSINDYTYDILVSVHPFWLW